jgi:hypothetical protein
MRKKAERNKNRRQTTKMILSGFLRQCQQAGWRRHHLKVFVDPDAADRWLERNDPEGVAFEYEVLE